MHRTTIGRIGAAFLLLPACDAATPVPADPITEIATALNSVWVVALGEHHGHQEFYDWLRVLLRDPRIQERVDDIAVEFGNALYQPVADALMRGDSVSTDSVRMMWRNSVVSPNTVWDSPVYEAFVRDVQHINTTRTDGRTYRLLLADSPVEWNDVASFDDLLPFVDRSAAMAETVRREVLRLGRRALLIAGGAHLTRVNMVRPNREGVPTAEVSVVARLAQTHPGALFVVRSVARANNFDPARLGAVTPGTMLFPVGWVGAVSANDIVTMRRRDGSPTTAYGEATLADMVDAIIYWGPAEQNHFVDAAASVYQDAEYCAELERRSHAVREQPMNPELRSEN